MRCPAGLLTGLVHELRNDSMHVTSACEGPSRSMCTDSLSALRLLPSHPQLSASDLHPSQTLQRISDATVAAVTSISPRYSRSFIAAASMCLNAPCYFINLRRCCLLRRKRAPTPRGFTVPPQGCRRGQEPFILDWGDFRSMLSKPKVALLPTGVHGFSRSHADHSGTQQVAR